MKSLPLSDPGTPDLRSAGRYLVWVIRSQSGAVAGAVVAGVIWMVSQAVMPAIIGRAIDDGVSADSRSGLVTWAAALLAAGIVMAVSGVVRHRFSVSMWLEAAYRTIQLVNGTAARLGSTLNRRVATGEVVSVGANDIANIGNACDVLGRTAGSIVAFFCVAALLLSNSVTLGLVVLIGVPLLMVAIGPLLKPLQHRNLRAREMQGELNSLATDIVSGLRVLRGIGGEEVFHRRYVTESQQVREAGVRVGRLQSVLDALQVLLPGIFVVFVAWLGARFAVEGRITPGELVAFYGYATFLMLPLRTATEFANKMIRARVAAGRVIRILSLQPELGEPDGTDALPEPAGNELVDHQAGFVAREGRVTAIVCDEPSVSAALADRLGRFAPGEVTLGDVALTSLPRSVIRRRVVVDDTTSTLFSGRLRDQLDPSGDASPAEVGGAIHTASAYDVLDAVAGGLEAELDERGRSFSGGQRQRMTLARALLADADVLVLVEPTSAVDAHTEARIAARLRSHRAGRTTVVVTSSPLVLDQVDEVAFLADGKVTASGTHRDLLAEVPAYRRVVNREEDA